MNRRGALTCLCGLSLGLLSQGALAKTELALVPLAQHELGMRAAIAIAAQNASYPFGAAITNSKSGKILAQGVNKTFSNPVLHGEMDALENTGRMPASVYRQCILYTTLSPCSMCTGAILLYNIPKVIIGENKTFLGEEELLKSRGVKIEVLQNLECIDLMAEFIFSHPDLWNEDIGEL